jgi:transcriptional regulator with XRE-family HTH domain
MGARALTFMPTRKTAAAVATTAADAAPAAVGAAPDLGRNLKRLRQRLGWNLSRLAAEAGLPQSTMSKVESGQMSLNYDKLWGVATVLQVGVEELFAPADAPLLKAVPTARRTIDRRGGKYGTDDHYRYRHLSTELRERLMMPVLIQVGERSGDAALPMTNLIGERFAHVLEGPVEFHCEHYEPVTLETGDSLYVDAAMPHAFVSPPGARARVIAVLTSSDREYLKLCREAALLGDADASSRHRQRAKTAVRKRR